VKVRDSMIPNSPSARKKTANQKLPRFIFP
jgi:hypothetical protein